MRTFKSSFYFFKSSLPLLLITLLVISCSDDNHEEQFTGDVTVTLINKGGSQVIEGEAKEFIYDVILSKSFDKEISLNFDLENLNQFPNMLTIKPNPVIIPKGQTKGVLKIVSTAKPDYENQLTADKNFKIKLASHRGIDNSVKLSNNETIAIKAEKDFTPLTKAQRELLAGYKTQGIDISPWIGKIPVEVTVQTAAGGNFAPFDKATTKKYSGITYITLSEKATKEKPVLIMTNNAFGLNEYLKYVFRGETIENTEFWYKPGDIDVNPAGKAVIKAIGEDREQKWKDKKYSFNVKVDNLEIKKDGSVVFVRKDGAYDTYSSFLPDGKKYKISAVNFEYEFPLWDELVELTKGNEKLKENIITGGSLHPNNYITVSTILEDDWSEKNWVAPKGNYDNTKKQMTFKFNTDHANSGDYDIITVKYTSAY